MSAKCEHNGKILLNEREENCADLPVNNLPLEERKGSNEAP